MPRSKRAHVVHTSKTKKQTKLDKASKIESLRSQIESAKYVYLVSFDTVKTAPLQELRKNTPDSKFFFGKNTLVRLAIGTTPQTEVRDGIYKLSSKLKGSTALIVSSLPRPSMASQLSTAEEEFDVKLNLEGVWSEKTGFIDLSSSSVSQVEKAQKKTKKTAGRKTQRKQSSVTANEEEEMEEAQAQAMEDDEENETNLQLN